GPRRFTYDDANYVRMAGEVARARAIADLFHLHRRKFAKAVGHHLDNRSPGRGDQFCLNPRRIHRRVFQQLQRRWSRDGKRSVGALYGATAHVQWRADDFIDSKGLGSHRRTYNVDHGIDSADFVKVYFPNITIMDL